MEAYIGGHDSGLSGIVFEYMTSKSVVLPRGSASVKRNDVKIVTSLIDIFRYSFTCTFIRHLGKMTITFFVK